MSEYAHGDSCPYCSGCILWTETDDGMSLICDGCGKKFEEEMEEEG